MKIIFLSVFLWLCSAASMAESLFFQDEPSLVNALKTVQTTQKKGVFLFIESAAHCPLCNYMQAIVFPEKTVTDFYQQHFVSVLLNADSQTAIIDFSGKSSTQQILTKQLNIENKPLPLALFFNPQGDLLYTFQGISQQPEEFLWLGEYISTEAYQQYSFTDYKQARYASNPPKKVDSQAFFDVTFGDLQAELETAKKQGKQGIMLFFEMDGCPFCKRMRETIFTQATVQAFYKKHFLIFPIDILGDIELTDFQGNLVSSKVFSQTTNRVRSTPVIIFYSVEGEPLYRFMGITEDAQTFLWLADYVLSGEYQRQPFKAYQQVRRKMSSE
ncbi:thioredoxin family protein [Beggiatoa leptomitoformis]|uniref:Thioredoxin fold domain-containing protein n=1 Tax=Beggiatoa leptomitoformis TaxID=288004 RepID=A0A2N9YAB9_9GAMM|nr:thioredoxin fold domain-containing protein [Beggiatoa leptomitoformis]AUI67400.1 thioredoxin fold domain-containing protein [Beggiatoa leptomitoformis]QGX03562.1 thioredoxin fold domain-containing protein [Beggiatoa leptomitoformis]